jgi:hypothetical protein
LGVKVIYRELLFTLLFADALRIGEKLRHESTFNNNLPKPTNDVIANPQNPENPDSNQWLLRAQD